MSENANKTNCPCPPYPPYPPFPPIPPFPPTPPEPVEIRYKDIVLTKRLHGILYELMVKTSSNNVYLDPDKRITLTEKLSDIADDLLSLNDRSDTFENKFADILRDAPETFRSFKEVWDYVNVDGDPKSALIQMIASKQEAEEGKGLSTHDLTDILYEKLVNDYTREELNEKFEIIAQEIEGKGIELVAYIDNKDAALQSQIDEIKRKPNVLVNLEQPEGLNDYDLWFKIISIY